MNINKKDFFTISNFLSLLRLLLAIPLWLLFDHYNDSSIRIIIFFICLFGALTDILDGYIARRMNQVTEAGKIIDPLADKIVIGIIIIKLFLIGEIPPYYFLMIIGRDLLIFTGGIFVSKKLGRVLPSNMLGKITVIVISLVIVLIILAADRSGILYLLFYYLSIFLIFASLIGYIIRAKEFIKKNHGIV